MTKYELKKNYAEFKNKDEVKEGCTLTKNDQEPEVIKVFADREEALEELKAYSTSVDKLSGFYAVEEYYVEENEYDEDGKWIGGGDVWAFSEI